MRPVSGYLPADGENVPIEDVYDFDPAKLPQAHSQCMEAWLGALLKGYDLIVLDNTCIQRWEYRPYELAARLARYDVEIVEISPKTVDEIRLCAQRNRHRVPLIAVARQAVEFEHDERATVLSVSGV